jgi:hypothetical protein
LNSNKKKILFLLFSPIFTKGGHSKNFLNIVKHFEPEIKNYIYDAMIISYNNSKKDEVINHENISNNPYFNLYKTRLLKRFFPSGKIIFKVLEYLLNFIKTFWLIISYRPSIIYAYSDVALYLSFPFKKIFGYKLIYDMRGDSLDELKVKGASGRYIRLLSKFHKFAVKSTNLIFTVSSETKIDNISRCIPKFNYFDGEIFRYDETAMLKKKKELRLDDKFIFVYTGNARYYQFLDGTINYFGQFLKRYPDSFLLIITEFESQIFKDLLNKFNITETSYFITSLPQNKISELQQIADMGFLLREDYPLNHNSFPTKFAEYLASGVPVLMTPHIHSISPMIINNNLGEVIDIKNDYSENIDVIYKKYKNNLIIKKHCSDFAQKELMWQNKAKLFFKIIDGI